MQISNEQIDALLSKVRRPSRYVGGEINSFNKEWRAGLVKWALVFPDAYEIGMSHVGLSILYEMLNRAELTLADRVFTPWIDMEQAMREAGVPIFGLESRRELKDFDIVGITLPYEATVTNILTVLSLAGMPFRAKNRGGELPLIIGGGCGAFNPAPVEDFFDAIVLGDGEAAVEAISVEVSNCRRAGTGKKEILERLSGIRGVYVPAKLGVRDSKFEVRRAGVSDLDMAAYPTRPVVPFMQVVHDRVAVEIQRGCARGCRFCQAGYVYRPVRQRSSGKINKLSREAISATGHEELSFLSLSAGDYEGLAEILSESAKGAGGKWVNISLPSLRVETLTPDLLNVLKRALNGGFTLAPEAATERLRKVINKGNTEEELMATIERVFSTGWRLLKLYFMIGLPTETEGDVRAIADVANKALHIGRRYGRNVTVTVSVSTFVPKPHTPFQWARQISIEETKAKQDELKRLVRGRGLELKWHDPRLSWFEGIFARGDARLSQAVETAWKNGARFDSWDDQFKFDLWLEAFKTCGVNAEDYLRERSVDEPLPWDGLFAELDREFLKRELRRALDLTATPDCTKGECSVCGICNKDIKNVTNAASTVPAPAPPRPSKPFLDKPGTEAPAILHFLYEKTSRARWISHLELMHVFRRAFRRAGLPVAYSLGFHPHIKLSLERALKVGEEGAGLKGRLELTEPADISSAVTAINGQLPEGLRISAEVSK